jgi:hypothetical protein
MDSLVGEGAMEELIRRVVLTVRQNLGRGHIVDLDTLGVVCRIVRLQ